MHTLSRRMLLLVLVVLLPVAAYAAPPVENIEGSPIPSGASLDEIFKAMVTGSMNRGWILKEIEPGHAEATIYVRSHMAKVDIRYDQSTYSITYNDSENLKYNPEKGTIHKSYNKWVATLNMDIQRAFALL